MGSTASLTKEQWDFYGVMRLAAISAKGQPFIRHQIFSLIPVASDGVQYAAVDKHGRVYLNFENLIPLQVETASKILIHEAWHVLRNHHERGKNESSKYSHALNIAHDMEINDDISGLPSFSVFPSTYELPDHLTAEEYFELIKNRVGENDDTPKCGSGGGDKTDTGHELPPEAAPSRSPMDQEMTRVKVAEDIMRGWGGSGIGTQSGNSLLEWARKVRYPRTPWQKILRTVLIRAVEYKLGETDISWARRSIIADSVPKAIIPGEVEPVIQVAGAVDTSGSNIPNLDLALGEIDNIMRKLNISSLVGMTVDTEGGTPKRIRRASELAMMGGGGTDMGVGIQAIADLKGDFRSDIGIILTDGYTPWPEQKPKGNITWIVCLLPLGGGISEHVKKSVPSWAKVVEVID